MIDGLNIWLLQYYSCPETGQKFYTYEDLMRYVNYAKAAKLSIYSPVSLNIFCFNMALLIILFILDNQTHEG